MKGLFIVCCECICIVVIQPDNNMLTTIDFQMTLCDLKTETAPVVTQLIQRPSVSSSTVQPSVGGDSFLMRAPSSDSQSQLPSASNVPAKVDLLADFGGDPFAGSAMPNQSAGIFLYNYFYV